MSIQSDIETILANPNLTTDEKRLAIYDRKGTEFASAGTIMKNVTFTVGDLSITVTELSWNTESRYVEIVCNAVRSGNPILFPPGTLPFRFVNPPVLVDGTENVVEAAKQMLANAINAVT